MNLEEIFQSNMAHGLFEAFNGDASVENQPVLTVHSLLDGAVPQSETITTAEDADVFLCGKCKTQFTSITVFINHKKECSGAVNSRVENAVVSSRTTTATSSTFVVRKIQVPQSPISSCPQNVVFTEADLLSLAAPGLESAISAALSACSNIQITTSNTVPHAVVNKPSLTATVHQILPQLSSIPTSSEHGHNITEHPQTLELSFLDSNKVMSAPLLLTSDQTSIPGVSSVMFNINSAAVEKIAVPQDSDHVEPVRSESADVAPVAEETDQNNASADKSSSQKEEPNTVNIITEFHSSMVRSKKRIENNESESDANKKGNKLNCAYCWKSFTKNFDLQQHIRCHTGEKPFQCIVCGRAFAQKSNVKKHMQTHKVWPDGLSHTLPNSFDRRNSSGNEENENHSESDNNQSSHASNVDGNVTASEETVDCQASENSYACPYCPHIEKTYFKLKTHMKQHKKEKVYKCIVSSCGLMFHELDPFLEHTKSHESEMMYRCIECNKNFPSLYDLGAHQFTHSLYPNQRSRRARKYFSCSQCLNKYSTPAALDHHLATSSHIYSCRHCDKVFPCERYLRRHLHIHSGSQAYVCSVCSKGFKTENYLKIHLLIHSSDKPFCCSECKAAFNRKDKLKRHMLIHESVKRLKCPFRAHSGCLKEFNRPDKLKAHILTHSCVRPFSCKSCGQCFSRKAHLRDHNKKHCSADRSVNSCSFCGAYFSDSKDMNNHKCNTKRAITRNRVHKKTTAKQKKYITGSKNPEKFCGAKRRGRPRKNSASDDHITDVSAEVRVVTDDIPTAHIEIITTASGGFVALPSGNGIENIDFEPIIAEVVTRVEDEDNSSEPTAFCKIPDIGNSQFSSTDSTV